MQRMRPAIMAIAILALSATAVFAAGPLSVGPSHSQASASHRVETVSSGDPSEKPEASEGAEQSEAADASAGAEASHAPNHGCVVSLAAQTATPSGFKNHGAWVSSIAKDNHGHNKSQNITTCALPTAKPSASTSVAPGVNP